VGLTDEEIGEVLEQVGGFNMNRHMFARAIEAKLKEKNA
jgi:membrane carboxypeptidase/penicillin-binding protein